MRKKQGSYQQYVPQKCWVGDQQKICYRTREEAEMAALVAQYDHHTPPLEAYHCDYGDHWHLSSQRQARH